MCITTVARFLRSRFEVVDEAILEGGFGFVVSDGTLNFLVSDGTLDSLGSDRTRELCSGARMPCHAANTRALSSLR